jgi:hypothetical protein
MMTFSSARLFGCRTADKMWDQERERLLGPSSSVRPALSLARCLCRTRVSRPDLGDSSVASTLAGALYKPRSH